MYLQELKDKMPEFAKDVKLNLSSLISGTDTGTLSLEQVAGITLACAYATKHPELIKATEEQAGSILTEQ